MKNHRDHCDDCALCTRDWSRRAGKMMFVCVQGRDILKMEPDTGAPYWISTSLATNLKRKRCEGYKGRKDHGV